MKVKTLKLILFFSVISMLLTSCYYDNRFSFAVIADPHINGDEDHVIKFQETIDWIIENKDSKGFEMVFVLGDIAWGENDYRERNLEIASKMLNTLNDAGIPYIPVMGDNEFQAGCEIEYNDVFSKQYEYLSTIMTNWRKMPVSYAEDKFLQNFSFDYKDCHFVCPDFVSREIGNEGGELHDYSGGSWPFFQHDIETCNKPLKENISIMTHQGMFSTGVQLADKYHYSKETMMKIQRFLCDYRENIDANYGGHLHQNWYWLVSCELLNPIYHVRLTNDTWGSTQSPTEFVDNNFSIRWVRVDRIDQNMLFFQHFINPNQPNALVRQPEGMSDPFLF